MQTQRLDNSYNLNFVVNRSLRGISQLLHSQSLQSIPDGKLKIGNGKVTDYVKSESQCVLELRDSHGMFKPGLAWLGQTNPDSTTGIRKEKDRNETSTNTNIR